MKEPLPSVFDVRFDDVTARLIQERWRKILPFLFLTDAGIVQLHTHKTLVETADMPIEEFEALGASYFDIRHLLTLCYQQQEKLKRLEAEVGKF